MITRNPSVNGYIRKSADWQQELERLRTIVLECGLTEEMKWKVPVYTVEGGNVVAVSRMKEYFALSFFKGALLNDTEGILVGPGQNTQSARFIKFTSLHQVDEMESVLKAYIHEAVEAEKAGLKVDFKPVSEFEVPQELQKKFDESPAFKAAFETFTPGRQKGYLLHFSAPKQSKTRDSRIEKFAPRILAGKGMHD